MPGKWTVEDSRIEFRDRWITHRIDKCRMADGRPVHDYHVLEFPDWINVVALTDQGTIILVEEYRHGFGEIVIGLPAGTVDPSDENPLVTSQRELMEETGYSAPFWAETLVGYPNPATQNNRAFSYLAVGARRTGKVALDPTEEIDIVEMPIAECWQKLRTGAFSMQLLHIAALYAAENHIIMSDRPELQELAELFMRR